MYEERFLEQALEELDELKIKYERLKKVCQQLVEFLERIVK